MTWRKQSVDWSTLKVDDLLYENYRGQSLRLRVLSDPERKAEGWGFRAMTSRGEIDYYRADGSPYGPHLTWNPEGQVT